MSLSNREWKELEKLQKKSGFTKLSQSEQRRLERLEGLLNNEKKNVEKPKWKGNNEKYDLEWFKPRGRQNEIIEAMNNYDWIGVQSPSGTGKTSTVVWHSLNLLLKGKYDRIVMCKNVTEVGDDIIGLLKGGLEDKLSAHYEYMRVLFTDFMSKGTLECEEANGNIQFTLPNFILGATIKPKTIFILEEAQNYSPLTMKLLQERVSDDCLLVVIGDRMQRYAIKSRKNGFEDLLDRVTSVDVNGRYSTHPLFKYVEMTTSENMRGRISKAVTELYGS